jgi:hypothetical protein
MRPFYEARSNGRAGYCLVAKKEPKYVLVTAAELAEPLIWPTIRPSRTLPL